MKDLKEMIDEINIETIEKAINVLGGLKAYKKEKCKTCKWKVDHHICGVCNYREKEPEKPIEEQIFELIKGELFQLNKNYFNFKNFKNHLKIHNILFSFYKQNLFLSIMKGIHKLINENEKENSYFIFIGNDNKYYVNTIDHIKTLPSFFYFSSKENAKKALIILSNFFGINILDWWFKND
jgi:hypothetical protein